MSREAAPPAGAGTAGGARKLGRWLTRWWFRAPEVLGIPPGPLVGQAKRFLLELRMEHGPLGRDSAGRERLRWAEARGLEVPAPPSTPPAEG